MTFEEDHELLARMRAADPAADLPPADPERVARLLEGTMNQMTDTETSTVRTRRGPAAWLAAAAAVALLGGVGFAATRGDDSPPPAAAPETTVSELQVPGDAGSAKCLVPSAELLKSQTLAFDGTVTSLVDGVATLEVGQWYAGEQTDLVRVSAPSEELQALVLAVDFRVGQRYLVAATGAQVALCGFSGEYSAGLAAMYAEAFGG